MFQDRLCIPYIDKLGVYALKFRCIQDHDCKTEKCTKYLGLPGQEASIFGIVDADSVADVIHISEGELDRVVLKMVFPEDAAVGVPGATLWKEHWWMHFSGFDRVIVWPDGDKAGADLANRIRKEVRSAEIVPVPQGMDVNELFLSVGAEVMRSMVGEDDDDE